MRHLLRLSDLCWDSHMLSTDQAADNHRSHAGNLLISFNPVSLSSSALTEWCSNDAWNETDGKVFMWVLRLTLQPIPGGDDKKPVTTAESVYPGASSHSHWGQKPDVSESFCLLWKSECDDPGGRDNNQLSFSRTALKGTLYIWVKQNI